MSTINDHTGLNYNLHVPNGEKTLTDLYDEGWEFYDRNWPDSGNITPAREAMKTAPYSIGDFSREADAYWAGYEDAAVAQQERGVTVHDYSADDIDWAKEEIMKFLLGKITGHNG